MKTGFRSDTARVLIIFFLFFLFTPNNYTVPQSEKEGLKKIKKAEKLFLKYKYRNAVNKYIEAEKIVKSGKNLSRLYVGLSKSYYALGLEAKSREVIRKIADLTIQSKVDEDKLPRGYLKIYKEILAQVKKEKEESKIVKTEEKITELKPEIIAKDTEKPKKQVIERPGKKKRKKKSSIFPIVGGALALGAVAFLLIKKKDSGDTASGTVSLHIESTPTGADVYVDGASKGVTTPCDITVSEGSRTIRLVIDGWGETRSTQSFTKDQSYNLNAKLAPYQYEGMTQFSIQPSSESFSSSVICMSLDNENNIYSVQLNRDNNSHYLFKFDSSGNQLSDVLLSKSKGLKIKVYDQVFYNFSKLAHVDESTEINKYSLDGSYISNFLNSIPYLGGLDINSEGNVYILINGKKINYYYPSGTLIGSFSVNETDSDCEIHISDDSNYVYIPSSKVGGNKISKYDSTGNFIKSWNSEQGERFIPKLITGYGSGETEKIFIVSYLDTDTRLSIYVYSNEGVFLTRSTDSVYSGWADYQFGKDRITVGTNGILYRQNGSIIKRYSTSDTTEGSGTWNVASKLKRSNTKSSFNGFNNGLRLQKRVDRNAVKKELKDKKEGEKIR